MKEEFPDMREIVPTRFSYTKEHELWLTQNRFYYTRGELLYEFNSKFEVCTTLKSIESKLSRLRIVTQPYIRFGTSSESKHQRYRRRRKEFIQNYKMSKGCSKCGEKSHPILLDLHHVTGVKLFNPSSGRHRSYKLIKEELEKCVVLCCKCHRLLHEGVIEI